MKKFILSMLISFNVLALDDFDLYRYGPGDKMDIVRNAFVFKIVFYETHEELQKAFNNLPGTNNGEVRGFTMVSEFNDVCTTHVVKPKIWDDREAMAIMGHEVYHCTYADHKVVASIEETHKEEEVESDSELEAKDKELEMDGFKEECNSNVIVDNIAGCDELKET